jgi:hypothetical protein
MVLSTLKIQKPAPQAGFVRQTIQSDLLEGVLNIPQNLKHRMVEVILLPIEEKKTNSGGRKKPAKSSLKNLAGAWSGKPLVREFEGAYEIREDLD